MDFNQLLQTAIGISMGFTLNIWTALITIYKVNIIKMRLNTTPRNPNTLLSYGSIPNIRHLSLSSILTLSLIRINYFITAACL